MPPISLSKLVTTKPTKAEHTILNLQNHIYILTSAGPRGVKKLLMSSFPSYWQRRQIWGSLLILVICQIFLARVMTVSIQLPLEISKRLNESVFFTPTVCLILICISHKHIEYVSLICSSDHNDHANNYGQPTIQTSNLYNRFTKVELKYKTPAMRRSLKLTVGGEKQRSCWGA